MKGEEPADTDTLTTAKARPAGTAAFFELPMLLLYPSDSRPQEFTGWQVSSEVQRKAESTALRHLPGNNV